MPDVLRIACAAVAIVLMTACIYAMFRSRDTDQRLRFGSTALIALVVVAGMGTSRTIRAERVLEERMWADTR